MVSYLAELLIAKGYRVVGAVRDVQLTVESLPSTLVSRVELVVWDVLDQRRMVDVLSRYRPQEVYNFAAYSSGAGMYDNPVAIGEVNGLAVVRTLELFVRWMRISDFVRHRAVRCSAR